MRNPDDLRLVIAGRAFTAWTAATVTMAIDALADAFSVTAPFNPADPAQRAAFALYNPVKLYLGDDLILTGRIDKLTPTGAGQPITIEGRSLPGILADCSISGDPPELEHTGLTLAQIARKLCKPFGLSVRADTDTAPIEEARAEYGATTAAYLASLAGPRNVLLNSSYTGELVLSAASSLIGKAPVAHLVEGEPAAGETPLIAPPEASYDGSRLYSLYVVATQFAGEPDIEARLADPLVPIYRPHLVAAGETDITPAKTAARLRAESYASALGLSVKVAGWRRPDGKRWAERQAVTLKAPGAMVYRETAYIVAGVAHALTAGDRSTTLRLALAEPYSGKSPSRYPWVA